MWITAQELIKITGMPDTVQGIAYKAKVENWERRKVKGIKKVTYEYNISSLPIFDQVRILKSQKQLMADNLIIDKLKPKEKKYCAETLWAKYEQATDKQKEEAKIKVGIVLAVRQLINSGSKTVEAFKVVAKTHNYAFDTVKRWFYDTKGIEQSDLLPASLSGHICRNYRSRHFEMTPKAWDFFVADYFRLEQPAFNTCYQTLCELAKVNNWIIPHQSSLRRKIKREITPEQQILWRQGEHALMQLYPTQQRKVTDLDVLEWINGDCYLHKVLVKWYNGKIVRPKTWIWQDVRTRKILGYRVDISKNSDIIRLSLGDVIENYGIPKHITIDNTRTLANKWLSRGLPNRYRFKVKEDDPLEIISMLGIEIHWSNVLHSKRLDQTNVIERAFSHGGLGELIDKNPLLTSNYTQADSLTNSVNNKAKNVVDIDIFMQAIKDGIDKFNSQPNRNTEICQGRLSFNEAFNASYKSSIIKKASLEQRRCLLLSSKAITVSLDGIFTLQTGGSIISSTNRYYNTKLIDIKPNKVIIRFDPQTLHDSVLAYTLDGHFICHAKCFDQVNFDNTTAVYDQQCQHTLFVKPQQQPTENRENISILEALNTAPSTNTPAETKSKVNERFNPQNSEAKTETGDFNQHLEKNNKTKQK